MSNAERIAQEFESGEADLDHELPASGGSGKNRTKQEQVRERFRFAKICSFCEIASLNDAHVGQVEHKHEKDDTRRIVNVALAGEEKRKEEQKKKENSGGSGASKEK